MSEAYMRFCAQYLMEQAKNNLSQSQYDAVLGTLNMWRDGVIAAREAEFMIVDVFERNNDCTYRDFKQYFEFCRTHYDEHQLF